MFHISCLESEQSKYMSNKVQLFVDFWLEKWKIFVSLLKDQTSITCDNWIEKFR